jgi:hypothetical protein
LVELIRIRIGIGWKWLELVEIDFAKIGIVF